MSTECRTERRRGDVRAARLNGVDGVEVADDGRTLTVTFLGKAPEGVGPENIRIEGGRRITGIRALEVSVDREDDPELDDRMHITVDRTGDTSAYRLSIVRSDAYGRPGTTPYPGFDPRYDTAEFSFAVGRPTPLDCRDDEPCPPRILPAPVIDAPVIDYRARDFESLRSLVLDRMGLIAPAWSERHAPDLGMTLVELLAYTADQLSYQQDAVATEAYLDTARLRESVRRHARLIDYAMHDGSNARTFIALTTEEQVTLERDDYRFAAIDVTRLGPQERPDLGTVVLDEDLDRLPAGAALEVFEPLGSEDLVLRPEHNTIRLWTWGDEECVLPKGSTRATLRDEWAAGREDAREDEAPRERALRLRPGDVLIVEEILGARSGAPADADPTHRQAVRLTSVTPLVDELYDQPLLEVTWAEADALGFSACLSVRGGIDCEPIFDVTVVRGNVVPADHGRALAFCGGEPERFAVPPEPVVAASCRPPGFGCGDRGEDSPAAQLLYDLLERARSGRRLGPAEVRELHSVLGEEAVTRARLEIHLAPGTIDVERVLPATADAQAATLETLLAQVTYPRVRRPLRPVLSHAPVTQAAPYPDPRQVSAAQALLLAAIPGRMRERLEELWRSAVDCDGLSGTEIDELTVVFGARVVERSDLAGRPVHAMRELLARRARLLDAKLRRLEVLTARARAGTVLDRFITWEITHSWGERYAVGLDPDDPVLAGPAAALAGDPRAALPAVRASVGSMEWTPRRDLLTSGPRDRHLVGEVRSDGRLALRFGDGRHGAAPAPASTLRVAYRVGNGTAGNLPAEAITHLVVCRATEGEEGQALTALTAVTAVRNPLPATGGTEPEALDEVRQSAPLALERTRLRAVTPQDYADLAAAVPGVQRAAAEPRWTGSVQEMHVAVDALGTEEPGETLLDAVAHRLEGYRRIGHDLVVRPAALVPLDIRVEVCVAPGYQRGHVLAELRRVLGNRRLPDGARGFFHPDALTFGEPVRVSRLVAVAAAVPGVLSARVTRLRRLFGRDDGELAAGLLRLGPLEIAQCDNDPDRPENGLLTLVLGGGR